MLIVEESLLSVFRTDLFLKWQDLPENARYLLLTRVFFLSNQHMYGNLRQENFALFKRNYIARNKMLHLG